MEIGFIGLGKMGFPMARRLIEAKHHLVVFDSRKEAVDKLVALGAEAASSPKEIADRCETVMASLPSLQASLEVATGAGGVIEADELLLVEAARVDALLELLDLILGDVVERAAVAVGLAAVVVAHEPPPAPTPAGTPWPGACACGPAPRPVAMLKAPEPCSRWLWPIKMTSGRV